VTWRDLRPFRSAAWLAVLLVLGWSWRIAFGATTETLEWVIAVTSVLSLALAAWAWRDSWHDYRYILRYPDANGRVDVADEEVGQDTIRVTASLMSTVAAGIMLRLPTDGETAALLMKHVWLFYMWMLTINVGRERLSRLALRRKARR